jgi:hypothetical protein
MATEDTAMQITGINIVGAEAWKNGDKLLAFFDIEANGFRIHECLLIRTSRGFLLAQPPRGDRRRGEGRAIEIADSALRAEIAATAHRAFLAMGGRE